MVLTRLFVLAIIVVLPGCAAPMLAPQDRAQICGISVIDKTSSIEFRPNSLGNPITGPLVGATAGAIAGLNGFPFIVATVPFGALAGSVAGLGCGLSSLANPNRSAEFQNILATVPKAKFFKAAQEAADANTATCSANTDNDPSRLNPNTLLEIQNVSVGMGCGLANQIVAVSVDWRIVVLPDNRELGRTVTTCHQEFPFTVDEWLVDKSRAGKDIEQIMERTATRMMYEMYIQRIRSSCSYRQPKIVGE